MQMTNWNQEFSKTELDKGTASMWIKIVSFLPPVSLPPSPPSLPPSLPPLPPSFPPACYSACYRACCISTSMTSMDT